MAERRFLLVDSEVLPDVFLKVLEGQAAAGLRYGQQHFAGGPPGRDLPQRVL